MNGNMAPPHTAIIPEVMVGVIVVDTKGYFSLGFHLCELLR